MSDVLRVMSVLGSGNNIEKDFVRRILDKDNSPVLKNKDGSISTHSMSWGEAEGKYFVYPTVVRKGKKLKRLEDDKAWEHAMETGEAIEFSSPEEAAWFSKNYKALWGEGK